MWWIILPLAFTAGICEGRKRNVIDTCVILGENVTEDMETELMESFRRCNEEVLDKLSPPLRLAINQTDIYREDQGYDNTKYGMCFFITRNKPCRAPLKQGEDLSYIVKSFCHSTVTGHTLINTPRRMCDGHNLANVAAISLPETNKTFPEYVGPLENIIASMVLYKMDIEVYNNETDMVIRPGSPDVTWFHSQKVDSSGNLDKNLTLVGPAWSWWNKYVNLKMTETPDGTTFRCLWSEEVMDKSSTLALTTAATKSTPTTTATTTLTTTLTSTPTTTISSTSSSRAPTKPETEMETTTEFGATNSSDRNVTPSMVKAEANIDRTGPTIVAVVVPVLILTLAAATVCVVCNKRSQHVQEKTDTEKMMPEDEKLSDVSHEVDVDSAMKKQEAQAQAAQFTNTSFRDGEAPGSPVSSTPV